jgi:hypothetical protein
MLMHVCVVWHGGSLVTVSESSVVNAAISNGSTAIVWQKPLGP